jgi:pimeloyl-ACP methyl ester carboxylesterase
MNLRSGTLERSRWFKPSWRFYARVSPQAVAGLLVCLLAAALLVGAGGSRVMPEPRRVSAASALEPATSELTKDPEPMFSLRLLASKTTKTAKSTKSTKAKKNAPKAVKPAKKKVPGKAAPQPSNVPVGMVAPQAISDVLAPGTDPQTVLSPVPSAAVVTSTLVPGLPPVAEPAVFSPCKDSKLECAGVAVPFDPRNPSGERIDLFVSRRKATGPAPRIGVLFVNPGGPGGPAYDTVRSASSFLTPELLERFDVIGVDPRGTERSAPLKCDTATKPRTSATGARLSAADAFADSCATNDAARLLFMDTQTAASDLDAVRVSLGESQINFLGMSYGTYLGAVYRAQFPDRVRSMILDSAVDPSRFGVNMLLDPVAATEKALDGFLDECASGRLVPCAFNDGTDLRAKYLAVREAYVKGSRFSRVNAERTFDEQMAAFIGYPRNGWPVLGRALEELAKTGAGVFRVLPGDNQSTSDAERLTSLDAFSDATNLAINCRDGILPRDPGADQLVRDGVPVVGPRFSGLTAGATAADSCVNWAAPVTPQVPLGPQPKAATLVIGNTFDLTTPYVWSQGLASALQAPLLTRNGGGHVAVTKSACVREASARFLIDNVVPGLGTICSPSLANPS